MAASGGHWKGGSFVAAGGSTSLSAGARTGALTAKKMRLNSRTGEVKTGELPVNDRNRGFVDELRRAGLVSVSGGKFSLTRKGIRYTDRLIDSDQDAAKFFYGRR